MLGKKPTYTGRDQTPHMDGKPSVVFQSTRPIRGATRGWGGSGGEIIFQSTRPIRGATQYITRLGRGSSDFNPRAPYGARLEAFQAIGEAIVFQSTRPIRGATCLRCQYRHDDNDFNPRAPYGARRITTGQTLNFGAISIHAPHTGRDPPVYRLSVHPHQFQSTRPIRGATRFRPRATPVRKNFNPRAPYGARLSYFHTYFLYLQISIHAPHTGRDTLVGRSGTTFSDFNPRAPYGARQQKCIIYVLHFCNNRQSKHKNIQETSSVRTFF